MPPQLPKSGRRRTRAVPYYVTRSNTIAGERGPSLLIKPSTLNRSHSAAGPITRSFEGINMNRIKQQNDARDQRAAARRSARPLPKKRRKTFRGDANTQPTGVKPSDISDYLPTPQWDFTIDATSPHRFAADGDPLANQGHGGVPSDKPKRERADDVESTDKVNPERKRRLVRDSPGDSRLRSELGSSWRGKLTLQDATLLLDMIQSLGTYDVETYYLTALRVLLIIYPNETPQDVLSKLPEMMRMALDKIVYHIYQSKTTHIIFTYQDNEDEGIRCKGRFEYWKQKTLLIQGIEEGMKHLRAPMHPGQSDRPLVMVEDENLSEKLQDDRHFEEFEKWVMSCKARFAPLFQMSELPRQEQAWLSTILSGILANASNGYEKALANATKETASVRLELEKATGWAEQLGKLFQMIEEILMDDNGTGTAEAMDRQEGAEDLFSDTYDDGITGVQVETKSHAKFPEAQRILDRLKRSKELSRKQIDLLQAQNGDLSSEVEKLKAEDQKLKTVYNELQNKNDALSTENGSMKEETNQLLAQIDSLELRRESWEKQKSELTAERDELLAKKASLEEANIELREKMTASAKDYITVREENNRMGAEMRAMRQKHQEKLECYKIRNTQLESTANSLQSTINDLKRISQLPEASGLLPENTHKFISEDKNSMNGCETVRASPEAVEALNRKIKSLQAALEEQERAHSSELRMKEESMGKQLGQDLQTARSLKDSIIKNLQSRFDAEKQKAEHMQIKVNALESTSHQLRKEFGDAEGRIRDWQKAGVRINEGMQKIMIENGILKMKADMDPIIFSASDCLGALEEKLDKLSSGVQALRKESERHLDNYTKVESDLQESIEEKKKARMLIGIIKLQLTDDNQDVAQLEICMQDFRRQSTSRFALTEEINALATLFIGAKLGDKERERKLADQIKELTKDRDSAKEESNNFQARMEEMVKNQEKIKAKHLKAQNELLAVRGEKGALEEEIKMNASAHRLADAEAKRLHDKNQALETKLENLESSRAVEVLEAKNHFEHEIGVLQREKGDVSQKLESYQKSLLASSSIRRWGRSIIVRLKDQVKKAEIEIEDAKTAQQFAAQKTKELEIQVDTGRMQLKDLRIALANAQSKLVTLLIEPQEVKSIRCGGDGTPEIAGQLHSLIEKTITKVRETTGELEDRNRRIICLEEKLAEKQQYGNQDIILAEISVIKTMLGNSDRTAESKASLINDMQNIIRQGLLEPILSFSASNTAMDPQRKAKITDHQSKDARTDYTLSEGGGHEDRTALHDDNTKGAMPLETSPNSSTTEITRLGLLMSWLSSIACPTPQANSDSLKEPKEHKGIFLSQEAAASIQQELSDALISKRAIDNVLKEIKYGGKDLFVEGSLGVYAVIFQLVFDIQRALREAQSVARASLGGRERGCKPINKINVGAGRDPNIKSTAKRSASSRTKGSNTPSRELEHGLETLNPGQIPQASQVTRESASDTIVISRRPDTLPHIKIEQVVWYIKDVQPPGTGATSHMVELSTDLANESAQCIKIGLLKLLSIGDNAKENFNALRQFYQRSSYSNAMPLALLVERVSSVERSEAGEVFDVQYLGRPGETCNERELRRYGFYVAALAGEMFRKEYARRYATTIMGAKKMLNVAPS